MTNERMKKRDERLQKANLLLQTIATTGRKFFFHRGNISHFMLGSGNKIWFVDGYAGDKIYIYGNGRWRGFSEGGTLRDLVKKLRDYIAHGLTVGYAFGPFPDWYSEGDPWGYGSDMEVVRNKAIELGIVDIGTIDSSPKIG